MSRCARRVSPLLLTAAAFGLACVGPLATRAAEPAPGTEVNSIQQAVQQGADIFAHDQFGGVRTCETCHVNGGRTFGKLPDGKAIPSLVGAAAAFPRFAPRLQSMMTLSQQLARCIAGGVQGKPPALGSPELVNLETYLTSLSKGAVMGQQFN
jgi:thiosulfate dehydrogenase